MKKTAILLALMFSCDKPTPLWHGIPTEHVCSDFEGRVAVCMAGDAEYTCVSELYGGCNNDKPNGNVQCTKAANGNAKDVMNRIRKREERDSENLQQQQMINSTL